ncbi:MAG TPA: hypothetical protein VF676_05885 [Flavobacterium sp.]|jgi:hypothetical protein
MKTVKTTTDSNKTALETLAENLTGMKYKRMQVRNRQYIRNLLKTNQQLLKDNNINSLILF